MFTNVYVRVAAAAGAADVVLVGVGNSLSTAGTDQSTHPSGAHVLRDTALQMDSTSATVGLVMEILGFTAFMVFLGYLAHVLYRRAGSRSGGVAAGTALVAGATMLAIKLASAAPLLALRLDRDQISPQLARVLNDMNGAAFVVSWLPFAVFVGAAAVALQQVGLAGRPTMYVGVVLGAAGVALAIIGINDPTGGNPVALLLGLLWVTVVSVRLAIRPVVDTTAETGGIDEADRVAVGV